MLRLQVIRRNFYTSIKSTEKQLISYNSNVMVKIFFLLTLLHILGAGGRKIGNLLKRKTFSPANQIAQIRVGIIYKFYKSAYPLFTD